MKMRNCLLKLVGAVVALVLWSGSLVQASERADCDAILVHDGWIGTSKTLIWRNVRLADIEDFSCLMWGGSVYLGESGKDNTTVKTTVQMTHGEATGFVMSSSATSVVVQFRHFVVNTIWCVKVTFTQEGDDVYGQANWARYHNSVSSIDVNLETTYKGGVSVATSRTASGYGAYQVTARCRTRPLPPGVVTCQAAHGFVPYLEPVLLWKNAHLSNLAGLGAWMDGGSMSPRGCTAFVMSNDGKRARVQFRSRNNEGTIWCVLVDFFQNGDCVYGQAGYAEYAQNTTSIDFDFDNGGRCSGGYPATASNNGSYGVYEISAAFNGERTPFFTGVCGQWILKEDRTIWSNVPLARVRNVRGVAGGSGSNYSPVCEQHRTFTPGTGEGTNDTLEVQMNYTDQNSNIRCVKVVLTQQGNDVVGRVAWAKYVQKNTVAYNFDAGGNGMSVATSLNGGGYGISRLQADIVPEDGETPETTDEAGNLTVLASSATTKTDLSLAGALTVNGAGPLTLNGANSIGVLAVYGIASAQHPCSESWFLSSGVSHVNEFVVDGTGVNTIGQLAWRDVTQLDKKDGVGPQIGLTLSGTNAIASEFVPPSYTFFRIAAGRTELPVLMPSTAELGNGSLFVVDEGATLALGGYDHLANYPVDFAVRGTLEVAGTLTLDGAASISGTGTVTAKALDSKGGAKLNGITFTAPTDGFTLAGTNTVVNGVTFGEGRTELAAGACLGGAAVTVTGTLAVPATATISSLVAPNGTLEVGEDTMLTVSNAVAVAGIGTLKVVSDDTTYAAWKTPRAFMTGPDLVPAMVKKFAYTSTKGLGWKVKVEDAEETGWKVATLACHPNQFIIIVR